MEDEEYVEIRPGIVFNGMFRTIAEDPLILVRPSPTLQGRVVNKGWAENQRRQMPGLKHYQRVYQEGHGQGSANVFTALHVLAIAGSIAATAGMMACLLHNSK